MAAVGYGLTAATAFRCVCKPNTQIYIQNLPFVFRRWRKGNKIRISTLSGGRRREMRSLLPFVFSRRKKGNKTPISLRSPEMEEGK